MSDVKSYVHDPHTIQNSSGHRVTYQDDNNLVLYDETGAYGSVQNRLKAAYVTASASDGGSNGFILFSNNVLINWGRDSSSGNPSTKFFYSSYSGYDYAACTVIPLPLNSTDGTSDQCWLRTFRTEMYPDGNAFKMVTIDYGSGGRYYSSGLFQYIAIGIKR